MMYTDSPVTFAKQHRTIHITMYMEVRCFLYAWTLKNVMIKIHTTINDFIRNVLQRK